MIVDLAGARATRRIRVLLLRARAVALATGRVELLGSIDDALAGLEAEETAREAAPAPE
jgi:hypothetical protein